MALKNISPFPYKVKLHDPDARIRWGDITDHRLIEYVSRVGVSWFNPLVKAYKKDVVNNWCNMIFTPSGWDFEEEWDDDGDIGSGHEYWLCFKKESDATFFALKWV